MNWLAHVSPIFQRPGNTQQLPLIDCPQMLPLTLHVVAEVAVAFTLMLQLPDGFGANEMPPFPEKVSGKASALFFRLNSVANVTLGSPLIVKLSTTQEEGVTVRVELSLPFPELSSVYTKSPATLTVPPAGQGPWYVTGMLQDAPLFVMVQPDDCARACSTISPKEGRMPGLAPGVSPATIAEFNALKSSVEIACACACETLLWLEPPQVMHMSERRMRAAIAHAMWRVGRGSVEGVLLVADSALIRELCSDEAHSETAHTIRLQ